MGKKSKSKKNAVEELGSRGEPLAEWRFDEPLFQMVLHPEKPILLCGLSNGFIYCYSYDVAKLQQVLDDNKKNWSKSEGETDSFWANIEVGDDRESVEGIKLLWRTKRHKGSVRCICLDPDGAFVYSVGTDKVLKKAVTETGKVVQKITLKDQQSDFTKMFKSATHPYLLLGDEDGNVTALNSESLQTMNKVVKIHGGDAINDIFQFCKRSLHKYISLGQTTLAYWDARESNESDFALADDDEDSKRKVLLSDNQEDEMLCGTFLDPEVGDTVVCGMGEGILTVWKPNKNDLEDQLNRIKICQNESIDCIVPTLQDDDSVWCGCSNGNIYKADVKHGRVVEVRCHSEEDEVAFIDLDYDYRVVSGGMDKIILWQTNDETTNSDDEPVSISESEDDELSSEENKGKAESEADDSSSSDSDDGETMVGLSKEELIAELDKDLIEKDEQEEAKVPEKPRSKKKRKISGKLDSNHGIAKFEGL